MIHSMTLRFVDSLYELTQRRSVIWERNPEGCSVYRASGYEVELCPDPCRIRILRAGGEVLESAEATALAQVSNADGRAYDRIIRELAQEAVCIATGLDGAIKTLLEALDKQADQQEGVVVHLPEGNHRRSVRQGELRVQGEGQAEESVLVRSTGVAAADYSSWT